MICCYLLVSMWGCRLTVLQGDTCKEIRIRHDVSLKDADICLLYNSDSFNGHYSAICRDDELLLETEKVTPKQGYRKELDVEWERNVKAKDMGLRVVGDLGGRTDSEMVLISRDMFDGLLKDRDFATKVRRFVETQEGGRGDTGGSGSTGNRGDRGSSRLVEESSQDDMEIDEEVKDRRIHRGGQGVISAKGILAQQGLSKIILERCTRAKLDLYVLSVKRDLIQEWGWRTIRTNVWKRRMGQKML